MGSVVSDIGNALGDVGSGIARGWHAVEKPVETVAPIAASFFLGPEVGALTGLGTGLGSAAVGAGLGAGIGATQNGWGGALKGGALGGLGGYAAGGGLSDLWNAATAGGTATAADAAGASGLSNFLGAAAQDTGTTSADLLGMPTQSLAASLAPVASSSAGLGMATPSMAAGGSAGGDWLSNLLHGASSPLTGLLLGKGLLGGTLGGQMLGSSLGSAVGGNQLQQYSQQIANNPYIAQLQALQANPGSVFGLPGAQAAIDAITRQQAATGNLGSGGLSAALASEGNQLYTNQMNTLGQLAGLQNNQTQLQAQYGLQGTGAQFGGWGGLLGGLAGLSGLLGSQSNG